MSHKTKIITTLIILLFAAVFSAKASAVDWSTQTLDNSMGARDISMAIDNSGKIHISYAVGTILRYATNSSGSFTITDVDPLIGNNGGYTSIAINNAGIIFISYYDGVDGDLMLATKGLNGLWTTETVSGGGDTGKFSSLALNSSGNGYIAFFDGMSGDLAYADNIFGLWRWSQVNSGVINGAGTSIAIDSNSKVHIIYYDAGTSILKYITNISDPWSWSLIDVNAGLNPSLKVDANNKLHASYYDSVNGDLKYATNSSGSWVTSTIDSDGAVGEYSSLVLDSSGAVYISYYRLDNGSLKFATNKSGSWTISSITDFSGGGTFNSLVLGSDGKIYTSYAGDNNSVLMFASATGFASSAVSINSGAPYAFSREAALSFTTEGATPTQMVISENADFSGAQWEDYAATKTFTLSSGSGTKTVYAKFRNVLGQESSSAFDTISYIPKPKFVTKSAKKKNEVLIKKNTTYARVQDMDLKFGFPKAFAKKKYYLQAQKFVKYPPKYANAKKQAMKKYWQIDTDFNKFKKDLQLQFTYYYTDKEFKSLKKQNKSLKEKDLVLKYYDSDAKTWKKLSAKHSAKKNSFVVTFKKLLFAKTYFAIGKK